jgi:hypothetical protein
MTDLGVVGVRQDRQGEEIEALRRMMDKHPDVIRFALEAQQLRGALPRLALMAAAS